MARALLSVIIVTYRSEDEIGPCLTSIPRELDGRPVEIIVVDNSSGDETVAKIRRDFPEVILIESTSNLGFSRANNRGYEVATGEFILFLNPDTISKRVAYEHCLKRLVEDPGIGVISPRLVLPDGEMDLACRRSIPTVWDGLCRAIGLAARFPETRLFAGYNLTYLPDGGTYPVGAVNGAFMLCPRRVLLQVGAFDEQFFMYGDDLDLCYRMQRAGYKVVYDGRVEMIHIKGASSSKESEKMADAVFAATRQFYLKHFNPWNSRLVAWKYRLLLGAWQALAGWRARRRGYRRARPI